jgi:hypothetical protein
MEHRSQQRITFDDTIDVVTLVSFFENNHRDIQLAALGKDLPLLGVLFSLRQRVIDERFPAHSAAPPLQGVAAWLRGARASLNHLLADHDLSSDQFQKAGELVTPLLLSPPLLEREMGIDATTLISQVLIDDVKVRSAVDAIFRRSAFIPGFTRYRTVERHGSSCIVGDAGTKVANLAGIAHELGHCLAEERRPVVSGLDLVISEASAQLLEEVMVQTFLDQRFGANESFGSQWSAYQRRVDLLNLHLFEMERHSIAGGMCAVEYLFEPHLLVFRESYFTMPGYQALSAVASMIRLRLIDRLGPALSASTVLSLVAGGQLLDQGDLRQLEAML